MNNKISEWKGKFGNEIIFKFIKKCKDFCFFTIKIINPFYIFKSIKENELCRNSILKLKTLSMNQKNFKVDVNNNEYVLIDGMWDNPNYWLRYSMVRAALKLYEMNEVGVIGKYNKYKVKNIFKIFSVNKIIDFERHSRIRKKHHEEALIILEDVNNQEDFLKVTLPYAMPAKIFYDAILKLQRRSSLDVNDKSMSFFVAEGLACIDAANDILDQYNYKILLLSHAVSFSYAALAWCAIQRNIPVILLYGDYGTCRFILLKDEDDIFSYPGRPTISEINSLDSERRKKLIKVGEKYLNMRLLGETNDLSAKFAYISNKQEITKEKICNSFNWDINKPIISIYASNWFDYPHSFGLKHFYDFYDWIAATLEIAANNNGANWLFKPHPCDEWYGVSNYQDILNIINNNKNIRMPGKSWNGLQLIKSIDGVVTSHGTIGMEASFLEKPVLAVGDSWYANGEFITQAMNKSDYKDRLKKLDWLKFDNSKLNNVKLYSALYWGVPKWQNNFYFYDDSEQDYIYTNLSLFLDENIKEYQCEVKAIAKWYKSDHSYYHIYKNMVSSEYCIPQI